MDNDIKTKQDYLYQEIIDQNYDPEQFQQYIEQRRGLSLQLYTMQELINIVQAFKKGQKSQIEQQKQNNDPSFIEHKQNINSVIETELNAIDRASQQNYKNSRNHKLQESSNSSTKVYHQFILKENTSNVFKRIHEKKERIKAKIRSYSKIKEENFFGSTYIAYLIETPAMNWSVRRRFKDFEWLQAKLSELLPGYPIPPIPKKTTMRSFEDQHLEQRMNIFQKYINKLINIPEICSEQILQDFLSISNEQQFNNSKERLQGSLNSRGNRLTTLMGEELINKSQYKLELKQYEFYKKSGELLKNLNFQLTHLQLLMKQATNKAFQVSSSFNQLHLHINSEGHFKGAGVFELMGDFTSELGYKLENQQNFLHSEIQSFCKYEEKYLQNIVNYMFRINRDYSDMLGKYKNLSSVDFEQDEAKNINHNEKKIFQQYQQTRQNYRIKLSFLRLQIQRYKNKDFCILAKQWLSGLQIYVGGIKDLMLSGVDQLTRAQCVSEGKRLIEVQYASKKILESKQNIQKKQAQVRL